MPVLNCSSWRSSKKVPGHFAERHFAERHFAERHFAERHFADRHLVERAFCRTDSMTSGLFAEKTFCRNDNLPKIEKF